jgi:hypothetical protein
MAPIYKHTTSWIKGTDMKLYNKQVPNGGPGYWPIWTRSVTVSAFAGSPKIDVRQLYGAAMVPPCTWFTNYTTRINNNVVATGMVPTDIALDGGVYLDNSQFDSATANGVTITWARGDANGANNW